MARQPRDRKKHFTAAEAKAVGNMLGANWKKFNVDQFRRGMDVELEHGRRTRLTDVTHDDPVATGKVTLIHLLELPDYYDRLERMEKSETCDTVRPMASKKRARSHKDVEFAVDNASGHQETFKHFDEAAAFAMSMAIATGRSKIDTLVWSEAGAKWVGGDDGVKQYREDPEASVYERFEIKVNAVGRVP